MAGTIYFSAECVRLDHKSCGKPECECMCHSLKPATLLEKHEAILRCWPDGEIRHDTMGRWWFQTNGGPKLRLKYLASDHEAIDHAYSKIPAPVPAEASEGMTVRCAHCDLPMLNGLTRSCTARKGQLCTWYKPSDFENAVKAVDPAAICSSVTTYHDGEALYAIFARNGYRMSKSFPTPEQAWQDAAGPMPAAPSPSVKAETEPTENEYRKTATIRAVQYKGQPVSGVCTGGLACKSKGATEDSTPHIHGLEGDLTVSLNDWIATGVQGEHWAIKPDVFSATYEEVSAAPTPSVEAVEASAGRKIAVCFCGEDIEQVAENAWSIQGTREVCTDNHWHRPGWSFRTHQVADHTIDNETGLGIASTSNATAAQLICQSVNSMKFICEIVPGVGSIVERVRALLTAQPSQAAAGSELLPDDGAYETWLDATSQDEEDKRYRSHTHGFHMRKAFDAGRSHALVQLRASEAKCATLELERDERNKRIHSQFGYVKGEDGKCACAYCVGNIDAIAEHAADMECQLYLPSGWKARAEKAESDMAAVRTAAEGMAELLHESVVFSGGRDADMCHWCRRDRPDDSGRPVEDLHNGDCDYLLAVQALSRTQRKDGAGR